MNKDESYKSWQSRRKIKLVSKNIVIAITIFSIVVIAVLFNNLNQTSMENKKYLDNNTLNESTVQNNRISENIPDSILKSKYVTTYSLPNGTGPNGILADRNGLVWTSGSYSQKLFRLDPKDGDLRSYPIPEEKHSGTMVWSMIEDKDGNIWFSQFGSTPLWRFDPHMEKFEYFNTSSPPFQMKIDDTTGDIWFTTLTGNTIGVIQKIENKTESSYKIIEFPLGKNTDPSGLFFNNTSVWVAELGKGKIAKFDPNRNNNGFVVNVVKTLEIPSSDKVLFSSPTDVLVLNNETIWVTEHSPSTISKYDLKSNSWKRFSTAQAIPPIPTLPFWMRESLDHKGIWFNEHQGNRVAFLSTNNTLVEYDIPNNQLPETSPYMINNPVSPQNIGAQNAYYSTVFTLNLSLDPTNPNRFWFSQWDNDKMGVVDRTESLPFDIHSDLTKVVLHGNNTGQNTVVKIEISKNNLLQEDTGHDIISLKASSSMQTDGGLSKITATFTPSSIDLSKIGGTISAQLILQNNGAKAGNYTLGVSATDGLVTKTIFFDLTILQ